MKVYYIVLLNYRLTGHPENFKIKLFYFQERLSLWYNIILKVLSLCFLYVSSEITKFQKDLFFKEHFWSWRFSILLSILSIIECLWSVTSISEIKLKQVFDNILGKMFFQLAISGLGDLNPSIIWFSINEDNFWQVRW